MAVSGPVQSESRSRRDDQIRTLCREEQLGKQRPGDHPGRYAVRVLVTGASGALGRRLVPKLQAAGHQVIGTARSPEGVERIRRMKADARRLDLLDGEAVRRAVLDTRPTAVIHEATALAGATDFKHFDRTFRTTNQLRTAGTDNLLAAMRGASVQRFIAQSYAGWPYAREGSLVKTEEDPLDPNPPAQMQETLSAIRHVEQAITSVDGIALRYGGFYGDPDDPQLAAIRRRRLPLIGDGGGVWSFVHFEDAATATVLALERDTHGIYNVVDDDPAPVREWLPALAAAAGAKPPFRIPVWVARPLAGEVVVSLMTQIRGASNAKAKRELGWTLKYPSWRTGFAAAYSNTARAEANRKKGAA
jgi:nucleoside-diphosphate-sugar epimerase